MKFKQLYFGGALVIGSATSAFAADCNPNGLMMQQIACIEEKNEADAKLLGGNWRRELEKFQAECLKENPGGGSGGREDRATCVSEKIKKASKK